MILSEKEIEEMSVSVPLTRPAACLVLAGKGSCSIPEIESA